MGGFETSIFGGIGGGVLGVLLIIGVGIWLSSRYSRSGDEQRHAATAGMRHQDMERWVASIDIAAPPLEQPTVFSASGTPRGSWISRTGPSPGVSELSVGPRSVTGSQSNIDTNTVEKAESRLPPPLPPARAYGTSDWR
ncbi:hypothetical protein MKZ38_007090 [Zalerion maritima]|uniref:Uncharacterized protein n=1 Tax=Zalerion maritima TaxID=339359 RepID=A0AAD5RIG0_9PEZI|nr:hypothetical protein MKZ38_007090 [Zalerion maritima]